MGWVADPIFVGLPARTPELEALLAELDVDVRVPRADGLHLTLRYLGVVDDEGAVKAALERVTFSSFSLELVGLGTFGRTPKVLWADVVEEPALMTLSDDVDRALDEVLGPRDRPLRPHVTVGRPRKDPAALRRWRGTARGRAFGRVEARELVLYASRKAEAGPNRYEALLRVPSSSGEPSA
jgi:2'-5' RNA ligase